jgi:hypothetical protein
LSKPLPKTIKSPFVQPDKFVVARVNEEGDRSFWQRGEAARFIGENLAEATRYPTALAALKAFHEVHGDSRKKYHSADYINGVFICKIKSVSLETISLDELDLELAESEFECWCEDIPEWKARALQLALDQTGKRFYPQK